ncbi:hypothetical protein OVA11_06250 [Caulobacter sp. SL161]|uniref:hypothetical protein n=1 Tax=Caulobacter sp. SL161 TaxID=2995156 RepID=UPI002276CEF9|nr:hypothetical protein [Caulobacter sp. SL161]MCY1646688.1 hypothetical protein [Caulobacter sp. SL161]
MDQIEHPSEEDDIETPAEKLAVRAGYWRVTLPVWLVTMALIWPPILYLGVEQAFDTSGGLRIVCGFLVAGLAAGWMWWSFSAPRWRLWAYQRVTDLAKLEQLAVADGLVWPVSHPLTRTEFRFGELGARLRAFEANMPRPPRA